jgi:hypothetical protein
MKKTALSLAIFACVIQLNLTAYAAPPEYVVGRIVKVKSGRVYVSGDKGQHILEPLRVCHWCKKGLAVLITYRGITKAKIKPYDNPLREKPIHVYIIRDGR